MRVIRAWADTAPPQISAAAAMADRASRAMPACIFIVLLLIDGGGRRAPLRAAPRRPRATIRRSAAWEGSRSEQQRACPDRVGDGRGAARGESPVRRVDELDRRLNRRLALRHG